MTIDNPTPTQIPELWSLWQEAFGDGGDFLKNFERTAFSIQRCRVAYDESGKPVAMLFWFRCQYRNLPVAYLYAVATAKDKRGQGICRQLMANTHTHLKALGFQGALLVPSNESLFPFYAHMGYVTCGYIREFRCNAAKDNTAVIKEIDPIRYAALRRRYLPENGVLQEAESMAFLATQATLYQGEDFILAARKDKNSLYAIEMLGNTENAPSVLSALKCHEGCFRTHGNDVPFAMYHPLANTPFPMPCYFGLAFD